MIMALNQIFYLLTYLLNVWTNKTHPSTHTHTHTHTHTVPIDLPGPHQTAWSLRSSRRSDTYTDVV